jgi:hypothetical protein
MLRQDHVQPGTPQSGGKYLRLLEALVVSGSVIGFGSVQFTD